MDEQPVAKTGKFLAKHWLFSAFLGLVALVAIAAGAYYYNQYNSLNNILKNPNIAVEKQTKELVGQVSKLMMLPTDEQPTIATVTDAGKLKDQTFFAHAKNGDKVLIYVKARQAILYRPTTNIIVAVAPVNIAQNQAQPAPSGTEVQATAAPVTVAPTAVVTVTPEPTK